MIIDSDDDPYVKLYHGKAFQKSLKAKLIIEHGKGHLDDDSKTKRLPSVVNGIRGMRSSQKLNARLFFLQNSW